jgi:hypothetical protein
MVFTEKQAKSVLRDLLRALKVCNFLTILLLKKDSKHDLKRLKRAENVKLNF